MSIDINALTPIILIFIGFFGTLITIRIGWSMGKEVLRSLFDLWRG